MAGAGVLRIGTRSSPMAMAQAAHVAGLLRAEWLVREVEIVPYTTSGDRWTGSLAELGGKGVFVKEIDRAQLAGEVDVVVHCLKDIPGDEPLPEELELTAFLRRDDAHDAVVSRSGVRLKDLPEGARVGTSSVRRAAQLQALRRDLTVVPMRGNANSRLAKLDAGECDALLLAVAGLRRIGMAERITEVLPATSMVPAIGAGVLVLQCRRGDEETVEAVAGLDHALTRACATAERSLLRTLKGHCASPIAGHCAPKDDGLTLHAAVFSPRGDVVIEAFENGLMHMPEWIGEAAGHTLLDQGARALIDAIPHP
ncbi:hydroxymethylbilane synthase [Yinghuangia soli]|uniref:Porphobilinogen deaminase n=1 Tax=Yinghuangia soli TaxID=2908204 RepID=A0AA41U488_9ACTN|nr:hydroxymethylbilane synthase [Yinghuangia soli]MCF2532606.1 hydroxymethylbilane synthase [Yinghuangia soli]